MSGLWRKIAALTACILTAGCNTTPAMNVPKSAPIASATSLNLGESKSTFALDRMINAIDRRTPILAFPANATTSGMLCNYSMSGNQNITYAGGKRYLGDWSSDLGEVFYSEMSQKGYQILGDPSAVFSQSEAASSAEFLVGGRVIGMKGNFCHQHHWWDGRPLEQYSGEIFVEIEWSVLNTLTKTIVFKEKISGYYKQDTPTRDGVALTLENAIADTVAKLAAHPRMAALARGDQIPSSALSSASFGEIITVAQARPATKFDIDKIAESVATVRIGKGHGSAFFLGGEGYAITNAHVVGEASRVQLIARNGREAVATVVRKDKSRDVALLKSDLAPATLLSIRTELPNATDTVYAVGSPVDESLAATVTRGIVSGQRLNKATGLSFIQADAAISPGSSGGPLLDANGAVVGIAVSKLVGAGIEGVNLFIPIGDALKRLRVSLAKGA